MKQQIIKFFKRQWLLCKLRNAKANLRSVVQVWAATGKGNQRAVNNIYDKYKKEIDDLLIQIRMLDKIF